MLKILIADDQLIYRRTLQMMLAPYGHCVLVEDGAQAVQEFREALESGHPFQLVLLDIQMPNLDGQGALLQIRTMEKQKYSLTLTNQQYAFILMQTSLDSPTELMTAYKKGQCNGYIVKPVAEDELLTRLRKHNLI